jgi:hypothetical protein
MIKLQSDTVTAMLFIYMPQERTDGDGTSATESHLYLPGVTTTTFKTGRFRRIWAMLLGHRAGPPE